MTSSALELFGVAWTAMVLAGIALSWSGILVVARGRVILAVAASQAAACGAAAAMTMIGWAGGGHMHGDVRIQLGALAGGLTGTALAWRGSDQTAAWLFAAASAGTVLLVANSPYGNHDLLALQHSDALAAGLGDLVVFAVALLIAALVLALRHRELRLLAIDPDHAGRCGVSRRRWDLLLGAWLGALLSLAVGVFGLLYTFGCLVLPALIAARLATALWPVLILAPLIAAVGGVGGIVLGHGLDLPPGQATAALLALLFPVAAGCGLLLRR